GADVAHDEELPRPGAGQEIRHQARIRTPDEERLGMLAVRHQVLKALLVARKVVGMEAAQPQQQFVLFVAVHCTSGEAAASTSRPSITAPPASTRMYWCSAVARERWASSAAMRSRTSS